MTASRTAAPKPAPKPASAPARTGKARSAALDPARLDAIARTVHEALSAWAQAHGQPGFPPWDAAEDWMRASTRESVRHAIDRPRAGNSAQHDQWMAQRLADGWVYGPVKDASAKTHPMLVPYAELPEMERRKDGIVRALVRALADPIA